MTDVISEVGNKYKGKDKCPKCKRTAIKLISITDCGHGRRHCRDCKRDIRAKYPSKDFRKVETR